MKKKVAVAPAVLCLLLLAPWWWSWFLMVVVAGGGGGALVTVLVVPSCQDRGNAFLAGPEPVTTHLNPITSPFPFCKVKVIIQYFQEWQKPS